MQHKTTPSRPPDRASRRTLQAEEGCRHAGMTRWQLYESMLARRRLSPAAARTFLESHAWLWTSWNVDCRYQIVSLAMRFQSAPTQHRTATGLTPSGYRTPQPTRMKAQVRFAKTRMEAHFQLSNKGYQVFELMWHTVCKRDTLELASRCTSCQARRTTGTQDNTSWMAGVY